MRSRISPAVWVVKMRLSPGGRSTFMTLNFNEIRNGLTPKAIIMREDVLKFVLGAESR